MMDLTARISSATTVLAMAAGMLALTAGAASAQSAETSFFVEARGGLNVPTFDIADAADTGPSFGFGVGIPLSERLVLMGDADFGTHDAASGGPDIKVNHYMGKIGLELLDSTRSQWSLVVNAGAGAMTFDPDAAGVGSETYPAINVGAKLAYRLGSSVSLFVSPQGDIAFSDEAFVGTDNAWVWPFSAGVRASF